MSIKKILLPTIALGVALVPTLSTNVHAAKINCNVFARTISEAVCMQDMNDEVLTSMVLERQYELKDARDEKVYYIAKLKDGNVWMTQNLDFDLNENVTLTPDDTDIPTNWKPSASTWWIDDLANANQDVESSDANAVSGFGFHGSQFSVDVGDLFWNGEVVQQLAFNMDDPDLISGAIPDYEIENAEPSGDRHYHLGNYYNWLAAVASDDGSDYTDEFGEADQSICPAGWTLPRLMDESGGESQRAIDVEKVVPSFAGLVMKYTNNEEWISAPQSHPLYLNFSGMSAEYVGVGGALWSNAYANNGSEIDPDPDPEPAEEPSAAEMMASRLYAYAVVYNDAYAGIDDYVADNEMGIPIRCVARSREAIEANWIKGDEHEVESEEEGILKIDVPEEDGEIVTLMIDGEMVSEDSGIEVVEDTENGGFLITFPSEYLDTLDEGEHVVKATFTSGRSAYARLTVSNIAVPDTGVPDTGMFTRDEGGSSIKNDSESIIIAVAVSVVCFGVMTVAYRATHSKFKGF